MAEREDVKTLEAEILARLESKAEHSYQWPRWPAAYEAAEAVIASSWLAAHDEQIRAEERERLAGEDMREVVARALWLDGNPRPRDWENWPEWDREGFRETASVALRALAGEGA